MLIQTMVFSFQGFVEPNSAQYHPVLGEGCAAGTRSAGGGQVGWGTHCSSASTVMWCEFSVQKMPVPQGTKLAEHQHGKQVELQGINESGFAKSD